MVASMLGEMFALQEWRVELCTDGRDALRRISGKAPYDLLVFDKDLPGVGGLELARAARNISHRRRTPIVMISGEDCEAEAWRAGVDAFLRKPTDVDQVSSTIARLLKIPLKSK